MNQLLNLISSWSYNKTSLYITSPCFLNQITSHKMIIEIL